MKRVVVTGIGIVSSIGNNRNEVLDSLINQKSGIEFHQEFADLEFRSHVCGTITADIKELIPRKHLRFMGDGSAYSYISMAESIEDAGLAEEDLASEKTGLIIGSGVASGAPLVEMADVLRNKGARKVNPFYVPKIIFFHRGNSETPLPLTIDFLYIN